MKKFKFVEGGRYLVEVKGEASGRTYLTKRTMTRLTAFYLRDKYVKCVGLTARAFDTKTGKMLVVGEIEL